MSVRIAIANQKGGVGKTTSTIELSACLAKKGFRVLVIDLESQMDTTKYSGGNYYSPGIYEALKGELSIKDVIQQLPEYDLVSASPSLSAAEDAFSNPTDVLRLKKALNDIDNDYDFILIDTNPGRNRLLNMAYIASDYLIIPSDADDGSVDGIRAVLSDLKDYQDAEWSDAKVLGVIFTRVENTGMHRYQAETIKSLLEEAAPEAFFCKVRKGIAATECKTEGRSMQEAKPRSNPASDYRNIADEIIRILEE